MPPNTYGSDPLFEVVEPVLRNADGLTVLITKKRSSGVLSCGLFKEFERDGRTERSSFFQRRQINDAIELLKLAGEKMDKLVDEQKAAERIEIEQKNRDRRRNNGSRR